MSDKDILKDIFSEKLGNYEVNVNPQLWNAISSNLVTTSSTVGTALFTKLLIGGSISAAALIGGYFVFSDSSRTPDKKENTIIRISSEPEGKEEDNNKNTEVAEIHSLSGVKESIINNKDIKEESFLTTSLPSQNGNIVLPKESAQVLVKIDSPKPVVSTGAAVENRKIEEQIKPPVLEPNTIVQEEATTSTEEVILFGNVFTPNGDGVNDLFFIKTKGLTDFSIVIMNAKNMVVFKSNDPDFVWDGIGVNGEPVEEGKYLYYLTAFDKNGKLVNKYQMLTIERKR